VRPQRVGIFERRLVRLARRRQVPVQVIDEPGIERHLPLEVRADDPPDEIGELAAHAARRGGRRHDVPGLVEIGNPLIVEGGRRIRVSSRPAHRAVERGERLVMKAVRLVRSPGEPLRCHRRAWPLRRSP
jgi:hypothetical protein